MRPVLQPQPIQSDCPDGDGESNGTDSAADESSARDHDPTLSKAPMKPGEEWANALSHGGACLAAVILGVMLVAKAWRVDTTMGIACAAYAVSVVGTFLASTLSHTVFRQPWLNRFRAWDQAMIYCMIAGTYTPIIIAHAGPTNRIWLSIAVWTAALTGFVAKVALRHRINGISTVTYLMLGWFPAVPLIGQVPRALALGMFAGGVLYSIGVIFLINDRRFRYAHVVWHAFVMAAAFVHYRCIDWYCVDLAMASS